MSARFGRLRRRDPVPRLVRRLEKRDWVTDTRGHLIDVAAPDRVAAVEQLAQLGDEAAREALAHGLLDPDPRVAAASRDALVAAGDAGPAVPFGEALLDGRRGQALPAADEATLLALLGPDDGPAEERLAHLAQQALGAADQPTRARAQRLLCILPNAGIHVLVDALHDERLREEVASALGDMRDTRAVPALASLLTNDRSGSARVAAARALGAIRDPGAAESLMRASTDQDADVRDAAQEALDRLGMMGVVVGVARLVQPLIDRVEELERLVERRDGREALPSPPDDGH